MKTRKAKKHRIRARKVRLSATPVAWQPKVGDRVRLVSGNWAKGPSNPFWNGPEGQVVGTVGQPHEGHILPIEVKWDNGTINSYNPGDLIRHVEAPAPAEPAVPVCPNPGYRWLVEGDVFHPGDVTLDTETGEYIHQVPSYRLDERVEGGSAFTPDTLINYARPLRVAPEAGEGYRLLGETEPTLGGDEFVNGESVIEWSPLEGIGQPLDERRQNLRDSGRPAAAEGLRIRRKVPAPVRPTPPAGWRLLNKGETIKAGDQYLSGGISIDSNFSGIFNGRLADPWASDADFSWIRKVEALAVPAAEAEVEPGEGYRLVQDGEVYKKGDELLSHNGGWDPRTISVGDVRQCWHFPTRRKAETEAEEPMFFSTPVNSHTETLTGGRSVTVERDEFGGSLIQMVGFDGFESEWCLTKAATEALARAINITSQHD
jgi:hypothetical protein